jgi:Co/Zn/Cd efflux system component
VSAACCAQDTRPASAESSRYRRVLWVALAVNALMFAAEIGAGLAAGSSALQADALDFLGDAANYALSLAVLGLGLRWRARAALAKGATMAAFGLWVVASTVFHGVSGTVPQAEVMGAAGAVALLANLGVALMLYRFRRGDSNVRSVWICSRNDAIGNVAVLLAALGVFGTGTGWPDIVVASVMAGLALAGAWHVLRHAASELSQPAPPRPAVSGLLAPE